MNARFSFSSLRGVVAQMPRTIEVATSLRLNDLMMKYRVPRLCERADSSRAVPRSLLRSAACRSADGLGADALPLLLRGVPVAVDVADDSVRVRLALVVALAFRGGSGIRSSAALGAAAGARAGEAVGAVGAVVPAVVVVVAAEAAAVVAVVAGCDLAGALLGGLR